MIDVFAFEFFRNAIIAGILASIACGIIGTYVVVKQMVSVSGGISHAAFGGIGIGYFLGIDPIYGAFAFTTGIAVTICILKEKARQNMDTIIAAMWASGMAIGIIFIALTPGYTPDLFSFLFGNILLVPTNDLVIMGLLVIVILVLAGLLFHQLMAVTFDEEYAEVMNIPVSWFSLLLLLLVALTVVMLIRIVGIILVIALLALPATIAREFSGHLARVMVLSTVFGLLFTMGGLLLSYMLDVPSGATIILFATAGYAGMLAIRKLKEEKSRIPVAGD